MTMSNVLSAFGLLFGITLGCLAEFWVAFGNIQIKYSHKLALTSFHPLPVYKRCRWWIGFLMYILNSVFKFASYMFASLIIISPTSSLSIVINASLAYWYFGERLTWHGFIGSGFMMIGCVLSVLFGTHGQDSLTIDLLYKYMYTKTFILFTACHISLSIVFLLIGSCLVTLSSKKVTKNIDHDYDFENTTMQPVSITVNHTIQNLNSPSLDNYKLFEYKSDISEEKHEESKGIFSIHLPRVSFDEIPEKIAAAMPALDITEAEKNEYSHVLSCFFLAFTTAGLVAWVQMLGKVAADLLWASVFDGNNQFTSMAPFVIVIMIAVGLCAELYLISEIMRLFDAVLICPIYNSLFIFSSIAISAVFFNNFQDSELVNLILFTSGLLLIIWGMLLLMYGQTKPSMEHQQHDRKLSWISRTGHSGI
eukprot:73622_1